MADSDDRPDNVIDIRGRPGRGLGSGYGTLALQDPIFRLTLQRYGISPEQFASATPEVRAAVLSQIERALRNEVEGDPTRAAQEIMRQHLAQLQEERRETETSAPLSRTTPIVLAALSGQIWSSDGASYAFAQNVYQAYVYTQVAAAYDGSAADRALGDRIIRDVAAANAAIRAAGDRPWSPETQQTVRRGIESIAAGQETAVQEVEQARRGIVADIEAGVDTGTAIDRRRESLGRGFNRHEVNARLLDTMLREADIASGLSPQARALAESRRHREFAEYLADRIRGMEGGDLAALDRAIQAVRDFRERLGRLLRSDITSAAQFREALERAADDGLTPQEIAQLERGARIAAEADRLDAQLAVMQARRRALGLPEAGAPTPRPLTPEIEAILRRVEAIRDGTAPVGPDGRPIDNIHDLADQYRAATAPGRRAELIRERLRLEAQLRANPTGPEADRARTRLAEMRTRIDGHHTAEGVRTDYDEPEAFFRRIATIADPQQVARELQEYARYQDRRQLIATLDTTLATTATPVATAAATVPPAAGQAPVQQASLEPQRPAPGQTGAAATDADIA